ncbi:MAG: HDIG domain-containing metalloprotein [Acidobacteriota bacterium]
MDREQGWGILTEHVQDRGLRRHMQAVEAAMRHYAGELGGDPEAWGLAGLLHDFDWEIHPSTEQHPALGAPILRGRGVPEDIIQAILAHNPEGTGVDAVAPMDHALRACDEITGLIIAATLVRPAKDVRKLKVKSVKRNWKDKLFCAAVSRDEIVENTEAFSGACFDGQLELWQHVGHVLTAMQGIAEDLDLDGRLAAPSPAG